MLKMVASRRKPALLTRMFSSPKASMAVSTRLLASFQSATF